MSDALKAVEQFDPCNEAVKWFCGRSVRKCWQVCHRGDWMLWAAARLDVDRKLIVLAACDCAELGLKYVPKGENRPRKAIETARAWCREEATIAEVRAASHAASHAAAHAADAAYAAYAAAYAAYAAADAAAYAAYAAADAAADAAAHAADAAAHAADAAAQSKTFKRCAALVRNRIPVELIEAAIGEPSNE